MTVVASIFGHDISGTTTNRPTNMEPGMLYFDATLNTLYVCCNDGVLRSISGHLSVRTTAATGTNQGTAAAVPGGGLNIVTGADGTKGVILPTNFITDNVLVYNQSSSVLKVYPFGTNTINGGAASTAVTVEPLTLATFIALDGTNWAYDGTTGDVGPLIADSITGGTTPFPITGAPAATLTSPGGTVAISSGNGGGTSGSAGPITIQPGTATSGAGAAVTITGGGGAGGTAAGGNVNLVTGAAVSTGIPGEIQVNGNSATIFQSEALTATDATRTVFVVTRPMRLKNVSVVWTTGSTSGTLNLEKASGTTAPGSGTALLTGTVTLAGTANTVGNGTLSSTIATINLATGDRVNIVIAGTMTNLVGCRMTIGFTPI